MLIANPIYDTVFKFIMSDSKVAKSLLSAIIGEKIVELAFSSKEHVYKKEIEKDKIDRTLEQITVCHFDFEAKIATENGYKTVLIELRIYFLNYEIGLSDSPIIKVDYTVQDLTTGAELNN